MAARLKNFFRESLGAIVQFFSKLLNILLNYILTPIFFISFLGPTIIGNNYFMIVNLLKSNTPQIKEAADNPYTYALISYHIQLLVLILAFVFFILETIAMVYNCFLNHSISQLKPKFNSSLLSLFLSFSFIIIFSFLITDFARGTFSSNIDITLYFKELEKPIIFGNGLPPWNLITGYRITIAVYGILLSIWENKTLPVLLASSTTNQ